MKFLYGMLANSLTSLTTCSAQNGSVQLSKRRFHDLLFEATKARIIHPLGQPVKIVEPHYERGWLSSNEQRQRFYSLPYPQVVFTGNARTGYVLDHMTFAAHSQLVLRYSQQPLSAKTSIKELQRIFGCSIDLQQEKSGMTRAFISAGENGIMFLFNSDRIYII